MIDEKNGQNIDTIGNGEEEEKRVADDFGEPTKDNDGK